MQKILIAQMTLFMQHTPAGGVVTRAKGSGLGLSIAQSIVQSHGGTITATSKIGTGSCFSIQLPKA